MRENLQHHRVMSDMKAFQAHIDFSCSRDIMLLPGKGPFYFRGMLMVVTLFQGQCQVSLYVIFCLRHINVRFFILPADHAEFLPKVHSFFVAMCQSFERSSLQVVGSCFQKRRPKNSGML